MTGDLEVWTRDWRRLKHQKHRQRGGVEAGMLLDYLLYEGEHQSVQVQNTILTRAFRHERDKNKLRLMIPLSRRLADRRIGRHFSIGHRFLATPNTKNPIAFDHADIIGDQLIPATDYKAGQGTLRWQLYMWQTVCGVAFEHIPWLEGVTQDVLPKYGEDGGILWKDQLTGQEISEQDVNMLLTRSQGMVAAERFIPATEVQTAGDFGAEVYDPFRVWVDASVGQIKHMGMDQRVFLGDIRTLEWIEETFGSEAVAGLKPSTDLSMLGTVLQDRGIPVSGVNLKDLLPLVQGSQAKDDPDSVLVLTMYQPPSSKLPKGLRAFIVPEQGIIDADDNPYPEVPLIDIHWSAPGPSIWTKGLMRQMQALTKFIDKRFSQLGEASNAQLYELMLLGGDLKKTDIPTDYPGLVEGGIDPDSGAPNVQVVQRGQLPNFFPESIRLSMETLQAVGSSDSMSQPAGKFSQMRGPLALPMMEEILNSEDAPRFVHMAEEFSLEKMMRINRIKAYYPPIRTLTYTGEDLRAEVLEFHTDDVLRAGVDFTVTVDPGTIFPEMSVMREARIRERMQWAPGLYTNPRTGTMDWTKVAKDLKYNDRQRESSENRARKLARQILMFVRKGRLTVIPQPHPQDPTKQVPVLVLDESQKFIVYPFWNHNAMMDEYQDVMETTEFIEASPAFKRVMMALYEAHRTNLAQIDQARQQSVENKMVQGAMAQAAQQTAAKTASLAAEAAIEMALQGGQFVQQGTFNDLSSEVRQLLGAAQGAGGQGPPQRQLPTGPSGRRRMPPSPGR